MTDKELLELAAKAAGYEARWFGDVFCRDTKLEPYPWRGWNPLTDDGDALRLAVKLDRKSTRLNSSHSQQSRMPSSA